VGCGLKTPTRKVLNNEYLMFGGRKGGTLQRKKGGRGMKNPQKGGSLNIRKEKKETSQPPLRLKQEGKKERGVYYVKEKKRGRTGESRAVRERKMPMPYSTKDA